MYVRKSFGPLISSSSVSSILLEYGLTSAPVHTEGRRRKREGEEGMTGFLDPIRRREKPSLHLRLSENLVRVPDIHPTLP